MSNAMIGWQTIYKNVKINKARFKDTALLFAPPTDDVYFIAFRCVSAKNSSAIWIDNIAIDNVKPLPVKITAFKGVKEFYSNKISWQTNGEIDNSYFILQRSLDGVHFTDVVKIPTLAPNGTSSTIINYSIADYTPNMVNYYKLKVVDKTNKEFDAQNIIRIADNLPIRITAHKTFPNPTTDIINVVLYAQQNTKAILIVADNFGKTMLSIPVEIYAGDNILKADVSKLTKGIYYTKIISQYGETTKVKKFIKQ